MPFKKIPYKKKRVNRLKSQYRKKAGTSTKLGQAKRQEVKTIVKKVMNAVILL